MSYILDAIKKSEAERGTGSIPGLQTVHSSSLNYKTEGKQLWPYIIIGLLLLNAAGLAYYFADNNRIGQATDSNQTSRPAIVKHVAEPVPVTRPVEKARPVEPIIESRSENNIDSNSQRLALTDTDTTKVIDISELPAYVKERIPTLNFSGHVYSSSPIQRSIIINGSFKEEGDAINHEFNLNEITPRGAIFEYQGTLFEISVLTGWNVN